MSTPKSKHKILRKLLSAIGLSKESVDETIEFISILLGAEQEEKTAEKESKPSEKLPYYIRDDFMSNAETEFYHVLHHAIDGKATICMKVNLNDLFYVQMADRKKQYGYWQRINRKHVDFVLCHPQTLKPLVAVELDDSSHQRPDRQERDIFVDKVFAVAGLPLVRVAVQASYAPSALRTLVVRYLPDDAPRVAVPQQDVMEETAVCEPTPPACPKCGQKMVMRTVRRGKYEGNQFWGCLGYPGCRGVRQLELVQADASTI